MKPLTKPQKQALAALAILTSTSKQAGWSRWHIGQKAKWDLSSYPIKTMRALQTRGFVEPLCEVAVELGETGQCRCGCDRWKITDAGKAAAAQLNVNYKEPKPITHKDPPAFDPPQDWSAEQDRVDELTDDEDLPGESWKKAHAAK